jgi:hypothetical protein
MKQEKSSDLLNAETVTSYCNGCGEICFVFTLGDYAFRRVAGYCDCGGEIVKSEIQYEVIK